MDKYVFNILRAFIWNKKNTLTAGMHGVENFKTFPFSCPIDLHMGTVALTLLHLTYIYFNCKQQC
jgi:hypothetical protein